MRCKIYVNFMSVLKNCFTPLAETSLLVIIAKIQCRQMIQGVCNISLLYKHEMYCIYVPSDEQQKPGT